MFAKLQKKCVTLRTKARKKMMDEDFDIRQEQMSSNEKEFENALRPLSFNDFSGQQQVVENP